MVNLKKEARKTAASRFPWGFAVGPMLKLNNREKKTWNYSKFYFCGFNNNLYANKFYFTPIMQLKFMCKVYCYCSIWLNITYFYRELLLLNWWDADYINCSDCCVFSLNWYHI